MTRILMAVVALASLASAWPLQSVGRGGFSTLPACTASILGKSYAVTDCAPPVCTTNAWGSTPVSCDLQCTSTGWVAILCVAANGAIAINPTSSTTTTSTSSSSTTSTTTTTNTTTTT